jgi:hypothetical protein
MIFAIEEVVPTAEIGHPQWIHEAARSDISLAQSGQFIKGMEIY